MFTEIANAIVTAHEPITNALGTAVSWAWNEATLQQLLLIAGAIGVLERVYRGCQNLIDHKLIPEIEKLRARAKAKASINQ